MILRLFSCALFLIFQSGHCCGQEVFHRSYGGSGDDYGRAVDICASGGYIVTGSTNSFINPSTDVYLLRIDDAGEFMWGKNIGEPNFIEWGVDVLEDSEGNFLIAGYTNNSDGNSYDGLLLKTDSEGSLIWTKTFGGPDWDFFHGMERDSSGNIYLAGSATTDDGQQGWIVKTDTDGNVIWESFLSIPGTNSIQGISICANENVAFVGAQMNYNPLANTILAGVIDPNGTIIWSELYPELGDAEANGCVCDENEDMIRMIGTTYNLSADDISDMILAGVDTEDGMLSWTTSYGSDFEDRGMAITLKANQNLLICGTWSGFTYDLLDAYLSEVSPQGGFLGDSFGYILGGLENDILNDIKTTPDGGYITVGETNSFENNYQIYVIKVSAENEASYENIDFLDITTSTYDLSDEPSIKLFPNPASNLLNVHTELSPGPHTLLLIDLFGRTVYSSPVNSDGKIIIPSHIDAGLYIVVLESDGKIYRSNVVIRP